MRRAGLFLLCIVLLAGAPVPYRVKWQPRQFADCNSALFYAADHPTVGLYQYRLRGSLDRASIVRVPSLGYRGVARITYGLDPRYSVMYLPRWTWPNMTQVQRDALRDFLAALRNHEEGHREIAERALARTSSVTVIAATPDGAKRALVRALATQLQEQHLETAQAEKTYDRVTGHGAHQSDAATYGFRSGPNVVFSCR